MVFATILKAKAVFPTEGRAASIIRSPFCNPFVTESNILKPVGKPRNIPLFLQSISILSISSLVALDIWVSPPLSSPLDIPYISSSAYLSVAISSVDL